MLRSSALSARRVRLWSSLGLIIFTGGCSSESGSGPDPVRPQFYALQFADNGSLPGTIATFPFGGALQIESASLIPYAVGRTIDQRLINDRTGRGGSGGNTRDTTVARGQFMDIRVLREISATAPPVFKRDSSIVDVEVRDTMFIITRPHPDPTRVRVDTGYYVDDLLIVRTLIDLSQSYGITRNMMLSYKVTR